MATKVSDGIASFVAVLNDISAAIDVVAVDAQALLDKLTAINNSPGELSPEDQKSVDSGIALGKSLVSKLQAVDALTPKIVVPTTAT